MQIKSLAQVFDGWCREDQGDCHIEDYGFRLRVVVSKDIPPRHSIFSWIRGMGVTKFDEIFSGELSTFPKEWMIAFPERHTSIEEQRALIYQICKLNIEKNLGLKQLDILTSCPHIISDTRRECLSIISFGDGKKTYDQDYMM